VERFVLTARLLPGAHERALELAAAMPPQPATRGVVHFTVYLSEREVVFVIEGPDAQAHVRETFNDPVRSTEISPWLPLFDGPLHHADEVYHWSKSMAG
jgi:hypothetical protein